MSSKTRRRARVVFLEPAATQIRAFSPSELARLDRAIDAIAADPESATPHRTAPALRDYQAGGVRCVYFATALGSIVIVTYVEADEA